MKALIDAVQAYALAHYNEGGWDVIIECWSEAEFMRHWTIDGEFPSTPKQAIDSMRNVVSIWADMQADAINSAF